MPTWLLYSITVFVWGTSWIAIKYQFGPVAPEISIVYRMAVAGGLTVLYCLATRKSLRFRLADHAWIAFQSIFIFSTNYILIYYSEVHLPSGLVAICFSTVTVMNIINGVWIHKTRIRAQSVIAAALGIFGLSLVFWPQLRDVSASHETLIGLAFGIGATFSASLGMMISVFLRKRAIPVLESNALGMLYGALFALLVSLLLGVTPTLDARPSYYWALLYLSIPATIVGFACYLTLIQRIGPDRAAYSSVLFPIVALAISTFAEDYHWTIWAVLGVMFVLGGNVLMLRKPRAVAGLSGDRPAKVAP
ncbi:MAG TPA: DMT family transporter [Dongiaceae bacterium]|jgi:drug/metabolite transporter (DMT)-like permease|nr:DMT family transporter [Dongiaceae bacterium]